MTGLVGGQRHNYAICIKNIKEVPELNDEYRVYEIEQSKLQLIRIINNMEISTISRGIIGQPNDMLTNGYGILRLLTDTIQTQTK